MFHELLMLGAIDLFFYFSADYYPTNEESAFVAALSAALAAAMAVPQGYRCGYADRNASNSHTGALTGVRIAMPLIQVRLSEVPSYASSVADSPAQVNDTSTQLLRSAIDSQSFYVVYTDTHARTHVIRAKPNSLTVLPSMSCVAIV